MKETKMKKRRRFYRFIRFDELNEKDIIRMVTIALWITICVIVFTENGFF